MTVSPQNNLSYLGVQATHPPQQIVTTRAPLASDIHFPIGTLWVNKTAGSSYQLAALSGGVASWDALGGGATQIATITGDSGGALSPTAGNINILGTANQITTTGAGSTLTLSVPATFIAPGSIASTTTLTGGTGITATTGNIVASTGNITSTLGSVAAATTVTAGTGITATTGNIVASTGNITSTLGSVSAATTVTAGTGITATTGAITATNGNLVLGTAGNKIISTSVGTTTAAGANSFGKVTLTGGSATVSTTAVTAASQIMLTRQTVGATGANPLGELSIGTIVGATSFVINAWSQADATVLAATDVSSIGWMIIN